MCGQLPFLRLADHRQGKRKELNINVQIAGGSLGCGFVMLA
jgi:hypothetical protein